jgi:hypothetical protein
VTDEHKVRTYREELLQEIALAERMPQDVAEFLNQLAHANAQTLIGNYVVLKSRELVKRYSGKTFMMLRRFERINPVNRPLTKFMFWTGEQINPYRCEDCLTKKQRELPSQELETVDIDVMCRKCGIGMY